MRNALRTGAAVVAISLAMPSLAQVKDQTAKAAVRRPALPASADKMSEKPELGSLHLQQDMARRSQADAAMGKVLQKQQQAASSTIRNLK